MLDQALLRSRACSYASSLIGLGFYNGPQARAGYEQAIVPFDPPGVAAELAAKLSSCGLTCEAILRAVNVADKRLYVPYGPRSTGHGLPAVALQKQIALENQAWTDTTSFEDNLDLPGTSFPQPGDMILQGHGGGGAAWFRTPYPFEHVWTLVSFDSDGKGFWSVDGGEPDIEVKHKQFYPTTDGQLWVGGYEGPADALGKPVHGVRVAGWLDLANMPFAASGDAAP